ncbi:hypothetical protein PRK78_001460 [Emydomyces testavorans]|uniref:Uncharacterized protein n=1 Tax=Emydomyces testavorans TaxID=2070801 RepID=A0AAF0DCW9_9EURO|nr:hypothetical protein PRK78_001460 [Emydomyces testavorans]
MRSSNIKAIANNQASGTAIIANTAASATVTAARNNTQPSNHQGSKRNPQPEEPARDRLKIRFPAHIVRAYLRDHGEQPKKEQPTERLAIRCSDHVVAMANAETRRQQQRMEEMRAIVDETLDCGMRCGLAEDVTPATMDADLATGVYNPTRDPAFLLATDEADEVSPTSQPPPQTCFGYLEAATDEQRELLQNAHLVLKPYPLYLFHRHLHEHRIKRRSFVHVCRDNDDLDDYLAWIHDPDSYYYHNQTGNESVKNRRPCYEDEWPYNDLEIKRQVQDWRDKAGDRAKRLEEVTERWKHIMRQRARERRRLLAQQKRERQEKNPARGRGGSPTTAKC